MNDNVQGSRALARILQAHSPLTPETKDGMAERVCWTIS